MNQPPSPASRLVERLADVPQLDPLADRLQPAVKRLIGDDGSPVADALHGTWLGHPLHPMLTDVPIGAWTVAAVADLAALADERFEATADLAVNVGITGALGAALAGWADWSDTERGSRRLGVVHGLLNAVALVAYGISAWQRTQGERRTATWTALAGYALVGASGYLGAELSYNRGVGVNPDRDAPSASRP